MAIFDKLNITGLADSAAALYDDIEFNTSSFYNKPPPHPNVSFIIGGVLSFLSLVYWFVLRWLPTQRLLKRDVANPSWQLSLRTLISTLSDNDDPAYTCLRLTSQAMLLLGGYQLDYRKTFMFMIFYYTALSFSESMRVVLSLAEHQNLGDLVLVNKREKAATRTALKDRSEGLSKISLVATNVYEDLSRNMWIVTMVFITQATLISLVCIVIYRTDFMSTLDGTPDVPTVGTLGSWLIYCLGIFMQANYVLGPSSVSCSRSRSLSRHILVVYAHFVVPSSYPF